PWKTLRVSHFPTASTAAGLNLKVICSKPQTRRMSHYEWTKDGGQVTGESLSVTVGVNNRLGSGYLYDAAGNAANTDLHV
ncbi:MAG: hypothetical protein LAO78_15295, partial [Acidobacteriia bacterium]|nr:hypothetical protein [Terriglobia bacterium]